MSDEFIKDCTASLLFKVVKHKFCSKEVPQRRKKRKPSKKIGGHNDSIRKNVPI